MKCSDIIITIITTSATPSFIVAGKFTATHDSAFPITSPTTASAATTSPSRTITTPSINNSFSSSTTIPRPSRASATAATAFTTTPTLTRDYSVLSLCLKLFFSFLNFDKRVGPSTSVSGNVWRRHLISLDDNVWQKLNLFDFDASGRQI